LKKQIQDLTGLVIQSQEKQQGDNAYNQFMGELGRVLSTGDHEPIKAYAHEFELLTGKKFDVRAEAASVWAEFNETYKKSLSPKEVAEILKEDCESHLERINKGRAKPDPKEEPKKNEKKDGGNGKAKSLNNNMEENSASGVDDDEAWEGLTHEERIRKAAMM